MGTLLQSVTNQGQDTKGCNAESQMGLKVAALRGYMAVLLSSVLVWFYLIWSSFSAVHFPGSLVLKQAVCTGVCTGGCVGEAVTSMQECTVRKSVSSNRPDLLCGQQSPTNSVLSEA